MIPLLGVILVAIATTKLPMIAKTGMWSMLHEARTDFSMLLGLVFLLITGAGTLSLDARRDRLTISVRSSSCRILRHKPPEEAVALPLRALRIVGHLDGQPLHDVFELARRRKVHRLIQIIRRRVISLRQPLLLGDRLRRSRHEAHLHRQPQEFPAE